MKQKSRISGYDLDISFRITKTIDCMTDDHTQIMIERLERLKNEKFDYILLPNFEYEVVGNLITQRIEFIKGRRIGMCEERYRKKIYHDMVERSNHWTFCDFGFDNFIVLEGEKPKIYAIDFQSYNYMPSLEERKKIWYEDIKINNIVLELMTRDMPFRRDKFLLTKYLEKYHGNH